MEEETPEPESRQCFRIETTSRPVMVANQFQYLMSLFRQAARAP
jgi:hypothetical protein